MPNLRFKSEWISSTTRISYSNSSLRKSSIHDSLDEMEGCSTHLDYTHNNFVTQLTKLFKTKKDTQFEASKWLSVSNA
jgi:hypothetical protein